MCPMTTVRIERGIRPYGRGGAARFEDHVRDHEGAQKPVRDGRPSPDVTTGQRDRGEHAEHDGANAGDSPR